MAENNDRLTAVLDYLIDTGLSDPKRVAVCGTSRGAFLALHLAAHDPCVRCTAALAPVTDLTKLSEMKDLQDNPLVNSYNLAAHADALAGRPVWIAVGDKDDRVGTDSAIACARTITAASLKKQIPSQVELHVLPEAGGHATPPGAADQAAQWIHSQIK